MPGMGGRAAQGGLTSLFMFFKYRKVFAFIRVNPCVSVANNGFSGSFRFHFYSDEGNEPPHIHMETPDGECKFWLEPIRLARNKGVSPVNVREIEKLVFDHQLFFKDKFNDYFKP
jgi:hypothetical protein